MTSSFELPVRATDENVRHIVMLMLIRVAHVRAIQDQGSIQQRAVPFWYGFQFLRKVSHRRNVVSVQLGVVRDPFRIFRMVGESVETAAHTTIREKLTLRETVDRAGQVAK